MFFNIIKRNHTSIDYIMYVYYIIFTFAYALYNTIKWFVCKIVEYLIISIITVIAVINYSPCQEIRSLPMNGCCILVYYIIMSFTQSLHQQFITKILKIKYDKSNGGTYWYLHATFKVVTLCCCGLEEDNANDTRGSSVTEKLSSLDNVN